MGEGVAVEELHGPVEDADEASDDAPDDGGDDISVGRGGLPADGAELAKTVDDGHHQATQTDAAEAVCQGALEGSSRDLGGVVVGVEIPRSVDTRDGDMNCILEPLGNPVCGKGDEDDEADDLALAAPAGPLATGGIVGARLVFDVDGDEGHRIVGGKERGQKAADGADQVDVAVLLGDINGRLEHEDAKGDARDPRVKGKDHEERKDQKDDAARIVLAVEHVNGRRQAKHDVENARDPDELLGKHAGQQHVEVAEDYGRDQHPGKQPDGMRRQAEVVELAVEAPRVGSPRGRYTPSHVSIHSANTVNVWHPEHIQ